MKTAYPCNAFDGPAHGEHSLVHAGDDLADPCFHSGLVSEIGDVLARLSDDDPRLLGADERAEGEHIVVYGRSRAGARGRSW